LILQKFQSEVWIYSDLCKDVKIEGEKSILELWLTKAKNQASAAEAERIGYLISGKRLSW